MPDLAEDMGKVSKGLTALKEVWAFSTRVAALQQKYSNEVMPLDELFGAMLGFGDEPNPLAHVEEQLAAIDAKLDRVLIGIEELKIGQLGQGLVATYNDMKGSVYLIEKYFQNLIAYQAGEQPWTDAKRDVFVDKLLGTPNERDAVGFCAHNVVNLSPATQSPIFFDLLFPYLMAGATAANASQIYLKGAIAFRSVAETLSKGLILESFAVASSGGAPATVAAAVKTVTEKYKGWMLASIDNSFLPFAERLATYNFKGEYLGGHDTFVDAHILRDFWKPAKPSILQTADELAAKLMGSTRSVTLRVIPNVPPIADKFPANAPSGAVWAGRFEWEASRRPQTSLSKETLLDKLESSRKFFFDIRPKGAATGVRAERVRKVDGPFAEGAAVPLGFDKTRLSFLRYQFDLGAQPDGAEFMFGYDENVANREFPSLEMTWRKCYIESGQRMPEANEVSQKYPLLTGTSFPGFFKLPPEGQLSPTLVTYAYARFGPG